MDLQASILGELQAVEAERLRRLERPGLEDRVVRLKAYQQGRFVRTYPDLLSSARYGGAARFFLDDLYGPRDFTGRDRQFARIVPTLVRLFPEEVVATVERLARLHALSEQLDTAMGEVSGTPDAAWDARSYVDAWRTVGRRDDRRRQIAWTLEVGRALDRLVAKPLLGRSLAVMRKPAQIAGLGDLQAFLERGFAAFRAMGGAGGFLQVIAEREERLLDLLFVDHGPDWGGDGQEDTAVEGIFGQLP